MCYNTKLIRKAEELEKRFNAKIDQIELYRPNKEINAFSFAKSLVITADDQSKIQHYNWGLVPEWAKDQSIQKYTLNARIESLTQKPSFKDYTENRCLILADSFYEWKWLDSKGKQKQKFEIGLENQQTFSFAGIWSSWQHPIEKTLYNSYTLITTAALGIMKEINNSKMRMPVVLPKELEQDWLNHTDLDEFKAIDNCFKIDEIGKNFNNQQFQLF